jgi:ubiquinone/menaquinone biosynthesis C-methylase UbiE
MLEADKVFAGSVPENYDRNMVPLIFEPYAADMARRAASLSPSAVLETAAGTGVVTRALAPRLAAHASYTVTDLNQPMLDYAASRQPPDTRIEWRQADALALPFENAAFDLVCCQFGAMFFPDRTSGYREARRVLKPGGRFLFSVWDRIEENVFADDVTNALAKMFPNDPPRFMARTPHGRCLLSGNASSQRNRGQRSGKAGSCNRLLRICDRGQTWPRRGCCQNSGAHNRGCRLNVGISTCECSVCCLLSGGKRTWFFELL